MSYDAYTKSLLHFRNYYGSTVFWDEYRKNWTTAGNSNIWNPKIGSGSGYLDGVGDWIDTPDSADFDIGSGNFTIDCWFKKLANSALQVICAQNDSGFTPANVSQYCYMDNGSNKIQWSGYSGGTLYSAVGATSVTDTEWHHYAAVRNGNTVTVYLDGVSDGSVTVTGVTFNNSAYKFTIGRLGEFSSQYLKGMLDEFRFSKGIARWTSNFTPQTTPYTYDATYDKILIHFEGTDESTTFTDDNGRTWTANGNARIFNPKFGTCVFLDGAGDYTYTIDNSDYDMSSGDWTIDFWIKPNVALASPDQWVVYFQSSTSSDFFSFGIYDPGSGTKYWWIRAWNGASSYIDVQKATTITVGQWYHIAAVHNGTNYLIFQDGTQLGTTVSNASNPSNYSGQVEVGRRGSSFADAYVNGWVTEFRFSKGIARWTSNFTPPTIPYDNSYLSYFGEYLGAGASITKGLYHLSDVIDVSGNGNNLTNNNSVSFTTGKFLSCADFGTANTNKSLSVGNALGYAGGSYTCSLWIKNRTEVGIGGVYGITEIREQTNNTILVIFYGESSGRNVYFRRTKSGVTSSDVTFPLTMGTTNWYNLVLTYDASNVRGYVNGNYVGSVASSGNGTSSAGATQVLIGSAIGFYTSSYIDEAVYENGVVWSDSKVRKQYTYGLGRFL